jgi:membrane protein DedA with SNARE-associated domain
LESLIQNFFQPVLGYLQAQDPLVVCFFMFAIAFIENIFPPSPSDVMIVFGGALVGFGNLGFPAALLSATAGSVAGFMVMYKIGDWFGDHILEQGKIKFINIDTVRKVEIWFQKHGYWVIVINRFLTGTRAVVSFIAGMSEMKFGITVVLCGVSALVWNAILIASGYYLGSNWEKIQYYLNAYSRVVTIIVVLVLGFFLVRYLVQKKRAGGDAQ